MVQKYAELLFVGPSLCVLTVFGSMCLCCAQVKLNGLCSSLGEAGNDLVAWPDSPSH